VCRSKECKDARLKLSEMQQLALAIGVTLAP